MFMKSFIFGLSVLRVYTKSGLFHHVLPWDSVKGLCV